MSLWVVVFIALLIAWGLHVQRLNEKREALESELKGLRSARKGLESSLASRARRLDVLFAAVNEVVMRVDMLGRVMAANPHANALFRMDSAPDLPQSLIFFYRDPEWHKAYTQALKALPEASSLPDMHIGGKVLAPRLAPLGKKQALLLCMDVTEKHRAEAQRKRLFANLMHDLKTPLTSILGYARSIDAFGDDAEMRREATSVIASESLRANEFLDSLLTLEHVDSFTPDSSARSALLPVIEAVLHGFASQMDEKQVRIEWVGDAPAVNVKVAEADLHRVLDNIIENALRYAPAKSRIFLQGSVSGNRCRVEITDQGHGVPEKELPRLTERFYRGDKARSKSDDVGHGLGLAIVKELLEKYGGSLELANHDVHGLIATINIPVEAV
jgi:two-component system phosphate regulon sensor histidine kinase PhoR